MTDADILHYALLRPAIIQILRSTGFHSTKPSVLDTLTDLTARYMLLLSERTASAVYDRTSIPHTFPRPLSPIRLTTTQDGNLIELSNKEQDVTITENSAPSATAPIKEEPDVEMQVEIQTQDQDEEQDPSPSPPLIQEQAERLRKQQQQQEAETQDPSSQQTLSLPSPSQTAPHTSDQEPQNDQETEEQLPIPNISDILTALTATSFFTNTLTPVEEAWRETLRRPLSSYPAGAAREKERRRRDAEDTKDVREFVDWCMGSSTSEMRRIAGLEHPASNIGVGAVVGAGALRAAPPLPTTGSVGPAGVASGVGTGTQGAALDTTSGVTGAGAGGTGEAAPSKNVIVERDDYIAAMKRKYSRVGDASRYDGTVLGRYGSAAGNAGLLGRPQSRAQDGTIGGDGVVTITIGIETDEGIRIEGGPESFAKWREDVAKRRRVEAAEMAAKADAKTKARELEAKERLGRRSSAMDVTAGGGVGEAIEVG